VSGQIIDASLVAAPRSNTDDEKKANRARMAQRRQSIWQSRYLAIRTMSRSIAVSDRRWAATDAAAYEGRRLCQGLLNKTYTAGRVWADTA
jgi:transposase, IS5 family